MKRGTKPHVMLDDPEAVKVAGQHLIKLRRHVSELRSELRSLRRKKVANSRR
jgi:hypothetical protein